jgi:sialidase-1
LPTTPWTATRTTRAGKGSVNGATPTTGRVGGAYHFDGNDSINVPDSPDFTLGADDFTMALWLKLDQATGNYYAMGHDEGPATTDKWIFWVQPGSSRFLLHVNGGSNFNVISPATWIADTEWRHLAITRDATLFSFYLDGALMGTDSNGSSIPDPSTSFQMGTAESGHPERLLRGALDEVRLYDRALSASEIALLVPEPSTALLLALGLAGLAGCGGGLCCSWSLLHAARQAHPGRGQGGASGR